MGLGAATDGVPEAPVALVNFVLSLAVALVTKGEFPAADVFKALVSRVLGYAVVAGAAVIKLPQILAVLRSGSADGISALSLEIESLAYGVSLASMLQSKLPFSAYGDLVFVVVQNAVLLSLVHMKSDVGFVRATAPSAVMGTCTQRHTLLCDMWTCGTMHSGTPPPLSSCCMSRIAASPKQNIIMRTR